MADLPPASGTYFLRDLNAVQEAVQAGTTQDTRYQRLYWQWSDFCAILLVNPTLQDPSIHCIEILQVYVHRIQHAKYPNLWMDLLGK